MNRTNYRHPFSRRVPFAIARHQHEAIGPRRRAEDGRPARRQRFNLPVFAPAHGHNRRAPPPMRSCAPAAGRGAVGHLRRSAAQSAHGRSGEQVVGTQTRYRVARHQEDRPSLQEADACRTRRPQRHAMHGQFAQFGQHTRRVIFLTDRRAAGDEQHVGIGPQNRRPYRLAIVRNQRQDRWNAAIAPHQRWSMTELLSTMR